MHHSSPAATIKQLQALWDRWTSPQQHVTDAVQRDQSKLLASLLLGTMCIGLIIMLVPALVYPGASWIIVYVSNGLVDLALLYGMYRISRRGHYRTAVHLVAWFGTISILLGAVLLGGELGLHVLYYQAVVLVFTSLFLTLRFWVLYFGLQVAVLLLFTLLDVTITLPELINGPLIFNAALSGLVVLIVSYRRGLDRVMQAELLQSNERYRILSELTSDFAYVIRVEQDGTLAQEWLTDSFTALSGYEVLNPQNQAYLDLIHPDDREAARTNFQEALRGKATTEDYRMITRQGSLRRLRISHHPIWDEAQNRVVRVYGAARDVTEEKTVEERSFEAALAKARFNLVHGFFRAVSHDFRTSLSIIETNRYLIERHLERDEPQEISCRLEQISQQITRLTQQLENLKEVSSLNSPVMELCDLNQMAKNAVEGQQEAIRQKNLTLTLNPDPTAPLIHANDEKVENAISHLIENAVHFTPEGGAIVLKVYHDHQTVMVDVCDTGTGIDPQDAPHIFDFFYRADKARSIESGGIGLGLSIVKMVAEVYGGKIIVDSKLNAGSTFTLAFPAAYPSV